MIVALYALSVLATVLAWTLARRSAEHRPIAYLLTVGLASDLAVKALRWFYLNDVIARRGVDVRWLGVERAAGHATDALTMTWPAALVGAALVVFLARRPWPALAGYVVAVSVLVITHP